MGGRWGAIRTIAPSTPPIYSLTVRQLGQLTPSTPHLPPYVEEAIVLIVELSNSVVDTVPVPAGSEPAVQRLSGGAGTVRFR